MNLDGRIHTYTDTNHVWTLQNGQGSIVTNFLETPTNQVLKITGGAQAAIALNSADFSSGSGILLTTFKFKTVAPESQNPSDAEFSDMAGAVVGFLSIEGNGYIHVLDGDGFKGGVWKKTYLQVQGNSGSAWVQLTIRQDFITKKWDLWHTNDGGLPKLVAHDLGFWDNSVSVPTQLVFVGFPTAPLYIDDLQLRIANTSGTYPAVTANFDDSDFDGVPDAWEPTLQGGGHERLLSLAGGLEAGKRYATPEAQSAAQLSSWWESGSNSSVWANLARELGGDLSGITWNPDTGSFYAIQNDSGKRIVELSPQGKLVRTIWTSARSTLELHDPEGIAYLSSDARGHKFAIAEERTRSLVLVQIGREQWPPRVVATQRIPLRYNGSNAVLADALAAGDNTIPDNSGLEGLCRIPGSANGTIELLGALEGARRVFKITLTPSAPATDPVTYTCVVSPASDRFTLAVVDPNPISGYPGDLADVACYGPNVYVLGKGMYSGSGRRSLLRTIPLADFSSNSSGVAPYDDVSVWSYSNSRLFNGEDPIIGEAEGLAVVPDGPNVSVAVVGEPALFQVKRSSQTAGFRRLGIDAPITEVMPDNETGIRDAEGKTRDWLELHNPRGLPWSTAGLTLQYSDTSAPGNVQSFVFPVSENVLEIPGGERVVLFASGKSTWSAFFDHNSKMEYHLPFKLKAAGGKLTLLKQTGPQSSVVLQTYERSKAAPNVSYEQPSGATQAVPLSTSTPGWENSAPAAPPVLQPPVVSNLPASLFSVGSVSVTFGLPGGAPPGTVIYYTTDGTEPYLRNGIAGARLSAAVSGQSIAFNPPVVIRAACSPASGTTAVPSSDVAFSILNSGNLFPLVPPADHPTEVEVQRWSTAAAGPAIYQSYTSNPSATEAEKTAAKTAITTLAPSISIVVDPEHLFWLADGIYANSSKDTGVYDAERRAAVEYYDPAGGGRTSVHAGLTISGHSSRFWDNTRKHSFKLKFRDQYGDSALDRAVFPVQPGDPGSPPAAPASFQSLLLRNPMHDSFQVGGPWAAFRSSAKYVTDQWVNRRLAEISPALDPFSATPVPIKFPVPHRRWVNLFLNGLYWGVYELVEEPDGEFADSALGKDKYDVIKGPESINLSDGVIAGSDSGWSAVLGLLPGFTPSSATGYEASATTLVASVAAKVDLANLIDYVLFNIYIGNTDWPSHNWLVMRRRPPATPLAGTDYRFRCLSWDAEFALKVPVNHDSTELLLYDRFNTSPATVFHHMCQCQAFRNLVEQRVSALFVEDPAGTTSVGQSDPQFKTLSPAAVLASFNLAVARLTGVAAGAPGEGNGLVGAEAIRWGYQFGTSHTPAQWLATINTLRNEWIPARTAIVRSHVQAYLARRALDTENNIALRLLGNSEGGLSGLNNANFIPATSGGGIFDSDGDGILDPLEGTGRAVTAGPWLGYQVYTRRLTSTGAGN